MEYSWEMLKIIFYLILVIAVIYILARYLRKLYLRPKGGANMEIVEQLYLDSNVSLKLVHIKDKIMLIGVTQESIEILAEWSESEFSIEKIQNDNSIDFKEKFKEVIAKYRRDDNE
ncbi:MAG: flagellar biosynthetic protein FliO [Bacillota bacterium]